MLSTSPDGSADKIQVFDFKMNYKLLSPSTISLYTPTFLSTMLQIVIPSIYSNDAVQIGNFIIPNDT